MILTAVLFVLLVGVTLMLQKYFAYEDTPLYIHAFVFFGWYSRVSSGVRAFTTFLGMRLTSNGVILLVGILDLRA